MTDEIKITGNMQVRDGTFIRRFYQFAGITLVASLFRFCISLQNQWLVAISYIHVAIAEN